MRRPPGFAFAFGLGLGLAACGGCSSREPPDAGRAAAGCSGAPVAEMGEATYYDATAAGSCSFEASADRMVAALDGPDYAHAAWCGACLAVSGPLGDVVVRVVDQCPGCKHGDLDLSREAFAQIAPLSAGRTRIAWHDVACPVTGPIAYQIKPGSNASWTAIQLRNHRHAIVRLEARGAGGAYRAIPRGDDNYFVASSGLGAGPYALRVTDVHGHTLEDPAIASAAGAPQPGAAQFPACP
ncbi:MAG TPA: expansin EXLX1 family cellulose-binding protein [Kofleriaceae bacterium]